MALPSETRRQGLFVFLMETGGVGLVAEHKGFRIEQITQVAIGPKV